MDNFSIWQIISAVIGVIAMFFGTKWGIGKGKLSQIVTVGSEAMDVANALDAALEDNKITKEEIANLKIQLAEVKVAWQKLTGKVK